MTTAAILNNLIATLSGLATPDITETHGASVVFETYKKEAWFRVGDYRAYSDMQEKIFAAIRIMAAVKADFAVTVSGNAGYNHISLVYNEHIETDFGNVMNRIEIDVDYLDD